MIPPFPRVSILTRCDLSSMQSFSVNGMIRGFHVYKSVWEPKAGEKLQCFLETGNTHNPFSVSVHKSDRTIVGHLPKKISSVCSLFMRRKGTIQCEVTGTRRYSVDLPQGGLEVPCKVIFEGPANQVRKAERIIRFAMEFSAEGDRNKTSDESGLDAFDYGESRSKKACQQKGWIKFNSLVLSYKERDIITEGEALNDLHINFTQSLLSSQFSSLNGFQSTLYQSSRPLTSFHGVVQIVHVGGNHWIAITTVDCPAGELKVFDSFNCSVDSDTQDLIRNLVPGTSLVLPADCPRQLGTRDCGLFATAVCTSIAFGIPVTIYNQTEMRSHLINCFEVKKLTPFN